MKRLALLLFILLNSMSCLAYDIEGDTNHDGALSGSEQYLLENPNIEGATPERVYKAIQKEQRRQEKIALWEEQDAIRARQARREAAYRRYLASATASTQENTPKPIVEKTPEPTCSGQFGAAGRIYGYHYESVSNSCVGNNK